MYSAVCRLQHREEVRDGVIDSRDQERQEDLDRVATGRQLVLMQHFRCCGRQVVSSWDVIAQRNTRESVLC